MTAATALAVDKAMVGQPAPDFNMASTKNIEKLNENVKLADYKGRWVVLLFYPLDFTFVCPTELTMFSDRYEDFQGIGADVIGVSSLWSVDRGPRHCAPGTIRYRSRGRSALQGGSRSQHWPLGRRNAASDSGFANGRTLPG